MAILCSLDILFAVIQLTKFQAAPRARQLKAACRIWGYLKNNPRFGILIDPSSPASDGNVSVVDATIFDTVYPGAKEKKVGGFDWKNLVDRLCIWACVDAVLNTDKSNGRSSTGFIIMVGNILIVLKARTQMSMEKSAYSSEFVAC